MNGRHQARHQMLGRRKPVFLFLGERLRRASPHPAPGAEEPRQWLLESWSRKWLQADSDKNGPFTDITSVMLFFHSIFLDSLNAACSYG